MFAFFWILQNGRVLQTLTRGGEKRMNEYNPNRLLNRKEAADFLGVKEITLAIWKSNKRHGLPVVKVGRLAKYRYGDLLAFVERQTVNKPTDAAMIIKNIL